MMMLEYTHEYSSTHRAAVVMTELRKKLSFRGGRILPHLSEDYRTKLQVYFALPPELELAPDTPVPLGCRIVFVAEVIQDELGVSIL